MRAAIAAAKRPANVLSAQDLSLIHIFYRTSVKSQGMKQLMAGGGVALIGMTLVPLLSGLFG